MVLYNHYIEPPASEKHLEFVLVSRFNFQEHLENVLKKVNKIIGLTKALTWKFQNMLLGPPFITIFKSFIRSNLDYRDVICDQVNNLVFI